MPTTPCSHDLTAVHRPVGVATHNLIFGNAMGAITDLAWIIQSRQLTEEDCLRAGIDPELVRGWVNTLRTAAGD